MFFLRKAIQYITTDRACMLSVFEPAFVVMVGIIFLDEYLDWGQLWGMAGILMGAAVTFMPNKNKHLSPP